MYFSINLGNSINQNCAGAPRCKQRGMFTPALLISFFTKNRLFSFAYMLAFLPDLPDSEHILL